MGLIARKIVRTRWPEGPPKSLDALWADSISGGCLRTSSNKLSVWRLSPDNWKEVVIAVTCRSQSTDTIDLVWLDEDYLRAQMIFFDDKAEGDTFIPELNKFHADIVELNATTLGVLALHTAERICDKSFFKRIIARDIKETLADAVRNNRLKIDQLHKNIQEKLTPLIK